MQQVIFQIKRNLEQQFHQYGRFLIYEKNYSSFCVRAESEQTLYSIAGTAAKPGVYLTKWEICYEGSKSVFNRRYVVTAGPSGFFRVKPFCFSFDTILDDRVYEGGLAANLDWFADVGGLDVTPGKVFTPTSKLKFKAVAKPGYAFCGYAMSQAYDYLLPAKGGKARTEPYEYGLTSPELILSPQMAKSYTRGYIAGKEGPNPNYGFTANPTNLAVRAGYVKTKDDFCVFMPGVTKNGDTNDTATVLEWPVGIRAKKYFNLDTLQAAAVGLTDMTIEPVGELPKGFTLKVGAFASGTLKGSKYGYPNGREFTVVCDPKAALPGTCEFVSN